jgi:hypothetical protein
MSDIDQPQHEATEPAAGVTIRDSGAVTVWVSNINEVCLIGEAHLCPAKARDLVVALQLAIAEAETDE